MVKEVAEIARVRSERRRKKIKKYIGIILGVIVAISVILFFYERNHVVNDGSLSGIIVKEGIIPGYTKEQIEEILQRKADESMFSFEINARPTFKDGKSEGNLRIANPPYNIYSIDVEIKLDSNNKTIFKSKMLKPNQYIENAKLIKQLSDGKYEATAIINAYDDNGNELKGTSTAKLIINIES